jgi:hypothetical protein
MENEDSQLIFSTFYLSPPVINLLKERLLKSNNTRCDFYNLSKLYIQCNILIPLHEFFYLAPKIHISPLSINNIHIYKFLPTQYLIY